MTHFLAKGFVLEKRRSDRWESEYFIMNVSVPNLCPKGLHYLYLQGYKRMFPLITEGNATFQDSSLYKCSRIASAEQESCWFLTCKTCRHERGQCRIFSPKLPFCCYTVLASGEFSRSISVFGCSNLYGRDGTKSFQFVQ